MAFPFKPGVPGVLEAPGAGLSPGKLAEVKEYARSSPRKSMVPFECGDVLALVAEVEAARGRPADALIPAVRMDELEELQEKLRASVSMGLVDKTLKSHYPQSAVTGAEGGATLPGVVCRCGKYWGKLHVMEHLEQELEAARLAETRE